MRKFNNPLANDLEHILATTSGLWEELRGENIFITGGTGFFGCWLLESFIWANDKLGLDASALVLTRNPDVFQKKAPHLAKHHAIHFLKGNIINFEFPKGNFSHVIHAAIYQDYKEAEKKPFSMVCEIMQGMNRVLEFCIYAKTRKMLLISTGAVYGMVPENIDKIPEDIPVYIDPANKSVTYHNVRRLMESLSLLHADGHDLEVKVARCFSLIGPYLPLNGRFAAGDFILDALKGDVVIVKGDGKQVRSYLYTSDLMIWLWTILFKGKSALPYNVGSEKATTILGLAEAIVHETYPTRKIQVLGSQPSRIASDCYIPDTSRAKAELSLRQFIPLDVAINKTMQWFRKHHWREESLRWLR